MASHKEKRDTNREREYSEAQERREERGRRDAEKKVEKERVEGRGTVLSMEDLALPPIVVAHGYTTILTQSECDEDPDRAKRLGYRKYARKKDWFGGMGGEGGGGGGGGGAWKERAVLVAAVKGEKRTAGWFDDFGLVMVGVDKGDGEMRLSLMRLYDDEVIERIRGGEEVWLRK